MSPGAVIFLVVVLVILFSVVQGGMVDRKWRKEFEKSLKREGFLLSPESKSPVAAIVRGLFQQKVNMVNRVLIPQKSILNGKEIYFVNVHIGGMGKSDLVFSDLFLFPFSCKVNTPFILVMKSDCGKGAGYVKDIATSKYILADVFNPDKLIKLELPDRSALNNILFAYSKEKVVPDELLDASSLSWLVQAGTYGFFIFYYNQGMAALMTLARYKYHLIYNIDWDKQWRYAQKLMKI